MKIRFWQMLSFVLLSSCSQTKEMPQKNQSPISRSFPGPVPYFPRSELNRSPRSGEGLVDRCNPPPTTGTVTVLVLPVIVDEAQTPPVNKDTSEELSAYLFGESEDAVTITSYYERVSSGALTVEGEVKNWRRISHSNAVSNETNGSEFTPSSDPIIQRALEAFDEEIDYADYDSDDDGCIDFLMVVHSGEDQAVTRTPSDIWSHFEWYDVESRHSYDDNISVYGGSIVGVNSAIGVYVHEFAHNLGLPDLYSYGPPNKSIVGFWSLMDLGMWSGPPLHAGDFPGGLDAYSLNLLGWADVSVYDAEEGAAESLTVSSSVSDRAHLIKIPLASYVEENGQDHYLLVQARRNATDRSLDVMDAGPDAYIESSGVLIWEIDENGANYDGSPRLLVGLADAYPNEAVRGIAPQALLADAPFLPKPEADEDADETEKQDGISSRYDANGVRIDVESLANSDSYTVTVTQDTTPRARLRGQWVRVTQDPHDLNQLLSVRLDITNNGSAPAENVSAYVADLPGNTWNEGNAQALGGEDHILNPGEVSSLTWTMTTEASGHFDLYARVSSETAGDLILRDKAYVDGQISSFHISDRVNMGDRVVENAARSWDWEYVACVKSQSLVQNPPPYTYATVADCRPEEGHGVCEDRDGDVYTNCVAACELCTQYDLNIFNTALHNSEDWVDFPDPNDDEVVESHTRGCYRGGGYNACRGEITKIWIEDFDGDGQKEILVGYRDIIQEAWCAAHALTDERCSGDINPLGLSYLSMYRYSQENGLGEPIWEFSAAEPHELYPSYSSETLQHQVYSCLGSGMNGSVISMPGMGKSILISGLCGGGSVLVHPGGATNQFDYINYPIDRPYGGDEVGFSANLVLTDGDVWGSLPSNDLNNVIALDNNDNYDDEPKLFSVDLNNGTPLFTAGSNLSSLFSSELSSAGLSLLRNQSGSLVEWYQSSPTDVNSHAFLAPRALMLNVNEDPSPEMIFVDGNGMNTGRVLAFEWSSTGQKNVRKIRERWGNMKSALLALDWDGDGSQEIIMGENGENAVSVFKYVSGSDSYEEIFRDTFGGYTGTAYNPGIAVGDVDGDSTPNLILGMGGHCSRPTVGDGVYVYGYGMVMHMPDLNDNGQIDSDEDEDSMGVFAIASGDLDDDGSDEIVVGTQSGDLIVIEHSVAPSEIPSLEVGE